MDREAEEFVNAVFHFLAAILIGVVSLLAASFAVQLAWNWSMPHLFALPDASYRNAAGLTLLAWAVRLGSVRTSKEG